MSRRHVVLFFIGLIIGVTAGEFWRWNWWMLLGLLPIAVWSRSRWLAVLVIATLVGIADVRMELQVTDHDVSRWIGQAVELRGAVYHPPTHQSGTQSIIVEQVQYRGQVVRGKLMVFWSVFDPVPTGSTVQFDCRPTDLSDQSRLRWRSHGVYAQCTANKLAVISATPKNWRGFLGHWQERLLAYVRSHYNEPQASLLNGIIFGNTDGFTMDDQAAFQRTGTTHIVALSGFNVTILITAMMAWSVHVLGRRWAWAPSLSLVALFVVMSGASASVVRAAIMAAIVQAGLVVGRPVDVSRLLLYTVLVMVVANPLIFWHDLGFQLSFLATIGLVVFAKPLTQVLHRVPEVFGVRESLSTTLGAIIATEPLLLWRFGRISLVAPFINMLVLPFVPLSMAAGGASLLGLIWAPLGFLTIPFTDAVLRWILAMITTAASWQWSMAYVSPVVAAFLGGGCCAVAWRLYQQHHA